MRRFSANASKARQATSRKKQIEKIKIEEIKPSSRQNPYIRFEQGKKLYRNAVTVEELSFRYPGTRTCEVLNNITFNVEAGERIAIIGPNGIGKTTLMRLLAGELQPTQGQDQLGGERAGRLHAAGSAGRVREEDRSVHLDERVARRSRTTTRSCAPRSGACCSPATRSRKSVKVLSGGEKGRMIYGKLMLTKPNVLLLDEPTNHMDMETIESLQIGAREISPAR